MLSPNFFNTFFIIPTLNILLVFYKIFIFIKIPGALGLAIISLTVLFRLALHPFFAQQIEATKKMQKLKPELDKLTKKHKKNPKKLQQEQMKLYQREGINPASSCLFMIIQMPVFFALYRAMALFLVKGNMDKVAIAVNKVVYSPYLKVGNISPWFFGLNLAVSPAKAGNYVYLIVPLLTALFQYYQAILSGAQLADSSSIVKKKSNGKNSQKEKKDESGDLQKAMGTQMKYLLPLMIGWFSYTLPTGLSVYWNVFSIFSIWQYWKMNR